MIHPKDNHTSRLICIGCSPSDYTGTLLCPACQNRSDERDWQRSKGWITSAKRSRDARS